MSSILDALQKSEKERKLNDLPTLTDMPAPQEEKKWPIFVLAGSLVVAIVVASVFVTLWYQAKPNLQATTSDAIVLSNETLEQASRSDLAQGIVVNVVSYSNEASQRFAMINGKMFREGEFVQAGLRVDAIKKNSVILNNRGRRIERHP